MGLCRFCRGRPPEVRDRQRRLATPGLSRGPQPGYNLAVDLLAKPDFAETKTAWRHYWAREKWKRPLVVASVPRDPARPLPWKEHPAYHLYSRTLTGQWDEQFHRIDRWLENTLFPAETVPYCSGDFGPDQFAAYLGATLKFSPASPNTNWVDPVIEDWDNFPIRLDPANPIWQRHLEFLRRMAAHARGRYLVGICDLHSNGDALSALRHGERLCLDFYDHPAQVGRAMRAVRKLYPPIYNGLYEASGCTADTGSIGWTPFWSDGRFATIQCDFICMISPDVFREHIRPALEEEAAFLDHCVFHLDGPGALPHLDDILAIKDIDVIQWVSGAGQKPMWQWLDVLKKCQAAGKGLQLYDLTCEQAQQLHRELDPVGLVYCVNARSLAEVEAFCRWLEQNS